jgi:hypothetical protein
MSCLSQGTPAPPPVLPPLLSRCPHLWSPLLLPPPHQQREWILEKSLLREASQPPHTGFQDIVAPKTRAASACSALLALDLQVAAFSPHQGQLTMRARPPTNQSRAQPHSVTQAPWGIRSQEFHLGGAVACGIRGHGYNGVLWEGGRG